MIINCDIERTKRISKIFKRIKEVEPLLVREKITATLTQGKKEKVETNSTQNLKKLYQLLREKELSMEEIAKEFNVTRRTANNYVLRLSKKLKEPFNIQKEYTKDGLKYKVIF